jgi:hypothetical protein
MPSFFTHPCLLTAGLAGFLTLSGSKGPKRGCRLAIMTGIAITRFHIKNLLRTKQEYDRDTIRTRIYKISEKRVNVDVTIGSERSLVSKFSER